MREEVKNAIEACRKKAELEKVLNRSGLRIIKDDSKDVGCTSVWVDEKTRIYRPIHSKTMIVQAWKKEKMEYSGTPVFFGTGIL